MNRKQRREYIKSLNTPEKMNDYKKNVYNIIKNECNEYYKKAYNDCLLEAIDNFMIAITYTLHFNESTSFGNKRIQSFMEDLFSTIDNFRTGEYEPQEYCDILKKDGIIVKGVNSKYVRRVD